jgi:hypothetical protein
MKGEIMYFKLLELFILKTLFRKGEYNITSKEFNPIKFFTILLLTLNVFFTIYLMTQLSKVHDIITKECPQIIINQAAAQAKEEVEKDLEKQKAKKEVVKIKDNKT